MGCAATQQHCQRLCPTLRLQSQQDWRLHALNEDAVDALSGERRNLDDVAGGQQAGVSLQGPEAGGTDGTTVTAALRKSQPGRARPMPFVTFLYAVCSSPSCLTTQPHQLGVDRDQRGGGGLKQECDGGQAVAGLDPVGAAAEDASGGRGGQQACSVSGSQGAGSR